MKENELIKKTFEKLRKRYPHNEIKKGFVAWQSPAFGKRRWDILGIFDLVLVLPTRIIFIQVTTVSNLSHRRRKIQDVFRECGFVIPNSYVYAWDKKKGRFKIEKVDAPPKQNGVLVSQVG